MDTRTNLLRALVDIRDSNGYDSAAKARAAMAIEKCREDVVRIHGRDLKLADVVSLWTDGPWGQAIVHKLEQNVVHLRRPYMAHGEYDFGGSVITTIGLEDFAASREAYFTVIRRGDALK